MIELPSIQQLENFIIYSQVKDFALAAEKAGVTQSAFRFQMKKLEEVVGAQLISHNNKNSELTEDGKIFLSKVEKYRRSAETGCERSEHLQRRAGMPVRRRFDVAGRCPARPAFDLF